MERLYIRGAGGRLGVDLQEVAVQQGIEIVPTIHDADAIALCVPSAVAMTEIPDLLEYGKLTIDLSGAAKRLQIGKYALLGQQGHPWFAQQLSRTDLLANPGCIAGAALRGLQQVGLRRSSLTELNITAVGGASYAPQQTRGTLWMANRLNNHPHVAEINNGLQHDAVESFVPVVSSGFDRGLLVVVAGQSSVVPDASQNVPKLDVEQVLGAPDIATRVEYDKAGRFVLGVAIDNIRFVTDNAIQALRYAGHNK